MFRERLQKLGQSIMLPVSILPVASLLMGVGYWIDPAGLSGGGNNVFAAFLIKAGLAIIGQLPILFAVGIATGLAVDKSGAAALSGLVSYLVITGLLAPDSLSAIMRVPVKNIDPAFGKISNVFIGIICGIVASQLYNRFHETKLPMALAFFSGRRLIPILSAGAMLVVSGIMFIIWPVAYNALISFGEAIAKLGPLGAGIYGMANKLLIPTGLHHAINSVFWFDVAGINDIGKFWSNSGVKGITGMYQAGFFPIMMYGLPAAALAIYKNARPEKKRQVASLMIAAAFATFFTGITEPIEFAFMFAAPALYFVHAFLTGVSMFIAATFHWTAGFGFSAGLVDYVLSLRMPIANKPLMLIPLGLVMAVIYYVIFDFMIRKFNLHTPGRETGDIDDSGAAILSDAGPTTTTTDTKQSDHDKFEHMAEAILKAVGGPENVTSSYNCITRIRMQLKDTDKANIKAIQDLGVPGVMKINKHDFHVVVGTDVQFVSDDFDRLLKQAGRDTGQPSALEEAANRPLVGEKTENPYRTDTKETELYAPANGELEPITAVNDDVFSTKMMGDGFAVIPSDGTVTAPVAGIINSVFPTKHAFTVIADNGAEVLIHLGIDTVTLKGKPFDIPVNVGDHVTNETVIAKMDLEAIKAAGLGTDVIVVFTNQKQIKAMSAFNGRNVSRGEEIGTLTLN
jgi:PTS system N-acetylglucosamine-specific IIC component